MQTVFNPFTGNLDLIGETPESSGGNFITNPNAEVDTDGWNLYNNIGRTVPASLTNQDLTFTSTLSGSGGNGIDIEYIYNASYPASTPNINVISPTHVQVQWSNGPTVANNPTATQLAAAWNGVPAAVAIATVAITGTASKLQYITGQEFLANGGDTAPINGTGGTATGLTFTRSTVDPIIGSASFILAKDAANREGEGVATDFTVNNLDRGRNLQVSFSYDSSAGLVVGPTSDITVWIYDITNSVLIPIGPTDTIAGPVGTVVTFVGTFTASTTSIDYRLIFHVSTTDTTAWTFQLDGVTVTDNVDVPVIQVPSLVLTDQPVSGAVQDHMCVMWRDGATQWIPATIAGAAIPAFGTDQTQLGFATNIVGSTADIFVQGYMDGFSFGPFTGFDQYIDNVAGGISPLPSPFTDLYVIVGMAISSTAINIQFKPHVDAISNGSGIPQKGGLLTSSAVNDGTGDVVLTVGANGNALIANSAVADGIQWAAPIVATTPFTFTLATRTLTVATATDSVAGVMSAADHTNLTADTAARHNAVTIGTANGLSLATQVLSLAAATNAVPGALTAADHTTYSGYAATIALKAPLASPVFTGDVSSSTGNVLIGTIGKGLQVKTGTNAKIGIVTLVAGTATVANSSITTNSRIFLTAQNNAGTIGSLSVTTITANTSFVIKSTNPLDTSLVAWMIVESIP